MFILPDDILKILLSVLAGGLIGVEREFRDKAAGFRTLIFICLGACMFTMLSARLALDKDPTRIAANIVTGIGFLGAGVILRDGGRVVGLTTAATIWLTAALGMGIGGGYYLLAGFLALVAMIVLWIFPLFEQWVDNIREERTYEVVCPVSAEKLIHLEEAFSRAGLKVRSHRQVKAGGTMTCTWQTSGRLSAHNRLVQAFYSDPSITEFRY